MLSSLVPCPPWLAAATAVVLLAVFVPLIRRCTWRTAALLAAVASAITFVGPLTGWLVESGTDLMRDYSIVNATGVSEQPNGGFLGAWVIGLGFLSMVAAIAVAVRDAPRPKGVVLRMSGGVALALAAATLLVAFDLLRIGGITSQRPAAPPEYRWYSAKGAGVGVWLTFFAALFGAGSAAGLLLKVRAHSGPASTPPR